MKVLGAIVALTLHGCGGGRTQDAAPSPADAADAMTDAGPPPVAPAADARPAAADSGGGRDPADGPTAPGGPAGPPFAGPTVAATVKVTPAMTIGHVAPGFLGFSFEKSHLTDRFFTAANAPLIALFKLLGSGVLRIGANDVDRTTWEPGATPVSGPPFPRQVGTVEVDDLAAFLAATGWKVIYGLDYKMGTPANDAAEASYVAGKLGASLAAFEIGNEIDRGPPAYSASSWQSFAAAVQAAAPAVRFAGPATDPDATAFAASFARDQGSRLVQLTHHYYIEGPRTLAGMLEPDAALVRNLDGVAAAASASHIAGGFRLDECNTFNLHGVPGVSNALASALWSLDFFFINAIHGSAGINFHGGRAGMDGTTPFVYAPIAEGDAGVGGVNPLFYGMLLMARAGVGNVVATAADAPGGNVSAYTLARSDGSTNVVLVNRDGSKGVQASVDVAAPVQSATALYLVGPALAATTGVTLGGAAVSPAGSWSPTTSYAPPFTGTVVHVLVPPASAALVEVR